MPRGHPPLRRPLLLAASGSRAARSRASAFADSRSSATQTRQPRAASTRRGGTRGCAPVRGVTA